MGKEVHIGAVGCSWQFLKVTEHKEHFAFLCLFFKIILLAFEHLVNSSKYLLWAAAAAGVLAVEKNEECLQLAKTNAKPQKRAVSLHTVSEHGRACCLILMTSTSQLCCFEIRMLLMDSASSKSVKDRTLTSSLLFSAQ